MEAMATVRTPQRRHARSNRERILAAARHELAVNPDASMDEIARSAGVVRRTVYGHFPNREALVEGLYGEALAAMLELLDRAGLETGDAGKALARLTVGLWEVGDRYRLLISVGRRTVGEEGLHDLLRPIRDAVARLLERGQADGAFSTHLPPAVLSLVLQSQIITLLEAVNADVWRDSGRKAAFASLVTAGVPSARAAAICPQ